MTSNDLHKPFANRLKSERLTSVKQYLRIQRKKKNLGHDEKI